MDEQSDQIFIMQGIPEMNSDTSHPQVSIFEQASRGDKELIQVETNAKYSQF
jgi:hypothetical protein